MDLENIMFQWKVRVISLHTRLNSIWFIMPCPSFVSCMTLPGEQRLSVRCLIRHIFECFIMCICGLFCDLSWDLRRYWWLFKCSWNPWNMLALLIYYVMICLLFYLDIVSFFQWFHWIMIEMLLFEHIVVIILVVINFDGYCI